MNGGPWPLPWGHLHVGAVEFDLPHECQSEVDGLV